MGKVYFLQPTVITNINTEVITACGKVFKPVVGFYKLKTEEEAIG